MYTVYICDDDNRIGETVGRSVKSLLQDNWEIFVFSHVKELCDAVSRKKPELAILDIELDQGVSGIDLAKKLFPEGSKTQVIFTTGYYEYCTDVYETEHIYFLLKPVKEEKLKLALERAIQNLKRMPANLRLRTEMGIFDIPISDILYIESNTRKLYIHTTKKTYEKTGKLASLPNEIMSQMVQCHKSYLINPNHVKAILSPKNSYNKCFLLNTEMTVPISQSKWRTCQDQFLNILGKKFERVAGS